MNDILTAVTLVLLAIPATAQEWHEPLRVPESADLGVVVDGFLQAEEWGDALSVPGTDPCEIYLKRHDGHVLVGVSCPRLELPVLDVFLWPEGDEVYQLHASAYLAERVLTEGEDVQRQWRSGLTLDWTANTVRWSSQIRDSLAAIGVFGGEMLKRAVLPFEGFEVRIGEAQFTSSQWRLRVQILRFASLDPPLVFPQDMRSGEGASNWFLLDLSSGDSSND
jgi:hypothetical protein